MAPRIHNCGIVAGHQLVDSRPGKRDDEIGRARAGAAREADDIGSAIRIAALRNSFQLRPKVHTIDFRPKGIIERNGVAFGRQFEIEVIGSGRFIRQQLDVTAWSCERKRSDLEKRVTGP